MKQKSKEEWKKQVLSLYMKKIDKKEESRCKSCSKNKLSVEQNCCFLSTREKIEQIWLKLRNWSRNMSGPQC